MTKMTSSLPYEKPHWPSLYTDVHNESAVKDYLSDNSNNKKNVSSYSKENIVCSCVEISRWALLFRTHAPQLLGIDPQLFLELEESALTRAPGDVHVTFLEFLSDYGDGLKLRLALRREAQALALGFSRFGRHHVVFIFLEVTLGGALAGILSMAARRDSVRSVKPLVSELPPSGMHLDLHVHKHFVIALNVFTS